MPLPKDQKYALMELAARCRNPRSGRRLNQITLAIIPEIKAPSISRSRIFNHLTSDLSPLITSTTSAIVTPLAPMTYSILSDGTSSCPWYGPEYGFSLGAESSWNSMLQKGSPYFITIALGPVLKSEMTKLPSKPGST